MNGYQIMQTLDERTNGAWRPSPGAVYPALSQLVDEGLVTTSEDEGQKTHSLTDAGREAATRVEVKPWDAANRAADAATPEGAHALRHEFGQLGLAARAVVASGDPALIERATGLVRDARQRVYGLLAGNPEADEGAR